MTGTLSAALRFLLWRLEFLIDNAANRKTVRQLGIFH